MEFLSELLAKLPEYLAAFVLVLGALIVLLNALIALFLMVPGEQPEKALQALAAKVESFSKFLEKFSRKPKPSPPDEGA